ncbi:NAD-dependent epimerase/dehydratase family protein [Rummeliibacillus suwonensis]|uniref:NAD-dependent epimerase/dehydratase family protein n=1 Tax=Rummeliibacillus suwonensis TaxID=1306154 RepID=UPI001AAE609E|nr:NAD-dependent epimerase/dehydratase family protein [Rummeliibacillus suwonensis]MBO2536273.1 NAD-dependent epimerase/dehydratase family protein [Rummeliibacillus suwonensis]
MKVLITGGYGFIGSHVAERFYKEDDEVFIIDNMETGDKHNISFKHKNYHLSVEDPNCEEIFKAIQFDVVVHLAAQVSVAKSFENPITDTESNIVGLVNMLTLSQKYKVKKFILASSAAVYGKNDQLPLLEENQCVPISPYGISKRVGELYCQKWSEMYGFESVCFRFSNVYGPRQNSNGEGGVVSIFINHMLEGKALQIYGDGEQTRDFIYVGDIADAIYRASHSSISGVYNLSTNKKTTINEVVSILKKMHDEVNIHFSPAREGDIDHSVLSNRKVMDDLDWSPIYDIELGLEKTYQWAVVDQAQKEVAVSVADQTEKAKEWTHIIQPFKAYLENLVVFLIIAWLVLSHRLSVFNATDISAFYIMIMGALYGSKQSILSVGLSIGLLIVEKLSEGREFVSLLYDTSFFFQVSLFLFIGLVVGYTVQRKTNRLQEQQQKIDELKQRYHFLGGIHTEVREIKDELQLRLLNTEDSFGKIYSIVKELDELEPEKVFSNAVQVVQQIMDAEDVSIYVFNKNQTFLRLVANTNFLETSHKNSMKVEDTGYIQNLLGTGGIFVNKELLPNTPIMAAPVYHNDQISAVIMIDRLNFQNVSLYHENLFKVTTELAGSALDKALSYIDAIEADRFIANTDVLKQDVFQKILESKREAREKYGMPYVVLEGENPDTDTDLGAYSTKLSALLRETDYIGQLDNHQVGVLLSNIHQNDVQFVLSRFYEKGIQMRLKEGEI